MLSRARHLWLRLPKVCAAIFGENNEVGYLPITAPQLNDCIINLTQRTPGTSPQPLLAASCNSPHVPHIGSQAVIDPVLPSLVPKLQSVSKLNSALERLWVIDCQAASVQSKNSWAAWTRRDITSDSSWPIPLVNVGGFRHDIWLARLPTIDSELPVDVISSPEILEAAPEGFAWGESITGIRLPTPMLVGRGYNVKHDRPRIRGELHDGERISCTLWENKATLLPYGPGELMKAWDLNERDPSGLESR